MSRFTRNVRITLLKGMEALGTTASNLASNAKQKVNEINLETRRREILTDFSLQAFELWQKGVQLPDSLSAMLTELSDIERRLSILRAEKYAKVNSGDPCGEAKAAAEGTEAATETTAATEAEATADAADADNHVTEAETEAPFVAQTEGEDSAATEAEPEEETAEENQAMEDEIAQGEAQPETKKPEE